MISVIVPVYNVENYITDCLFSIVHQTSHNFEIIIVNDGSTDDSLNRALLVLEKSCSKYTIINTKNHGVSAARNIGMEKASGEYAIMVDSDDIVAPDFIADFETMTREYPSSDILFCNFLVVKDNQPAFKKTGAMRLVLNRREAQTGFLNRTIRFLLPAMLVKTAWVREKKVTFDEKVRYSEDVQYIWRALAETDENVIYSPEENYHYLLHENSTMTASGITKIMTGVTGMKQLYSEICNKMTEPTRSQIVPKWTFAMLHGASKMMCWDDFFVLYQSADAETQVKIIRRIGDFKSKAVANVLCKSHKTGYLLMRRF